MERSQGQQGSGNPAGPSPRLTGLGEGLRLARGAPVSCWVSLVMTEAEGDGQGAGISLDTWLKLVWGGWAHAGGGSCSHEAGREERRRWQNPGGGRIPTPSRGNRDQEQRLSPRNPGRGAGSSLKPQPGAGPQRAEPGCRRPPAHRGPRRLQPPAADLARPQSQPVPLPPPVATATEL